MPTSEVYLHLSIYRQYDVAAVVHTHAPVSTARVDLALSEIPVIHYQQLLLGGASGWRRTRRSGRPSWPTGWSPRWSTERRP